MELCLIESCHPFPERLVNTWEKVAVREESSLTSLLLFLSLIKTQPMPIKTEQELLLFFVYPQIRDNAGKWAGNSLPPSLAVGLLGRRLCFTEKVVHRAGGAATYLKRLPITGQVTLRLAGADSHCRSWWVYGLWKSHLLSPWDVKHRPIPTAHTHSAGLGAPCEPFNITPHLPLLPRGCAESPQKVLSL